MQCCMSPSVVSVSCQLGLQLGSPLTRGDYQGQVPILLPRALWTPRALLHFSYSSVAAWADSPHDVRLSQLNSLMNNFSPLVSSQMVEKPSSSSLVMKNLTVGGLWASTPPNSPKVKVCPNLITKYHSRGCDFQGC